MLTFLKNGLKYFFRENKILGFLHFRSPKLIKIELDDRLAEMRLGELDDLTSPGIIKEFCAITKYLALKSQEK